MADNQTDYRSAEEIEQDIQRTQRDMSRTVDKLEDQFTPRNLFDAALDKANESGIDARYLLDAARRNPLALGMIGIGGLWLVSDADARPSALKPSTNPFSSNGGSSSDDHWGGRHHSDYVSHMASCTPQAGEDDMGYRRRRDAHRGAFLMIEQRHDEDESAYRQRLDHATDTLRESRDTAMRKAREASDWTKQNASQATSAARDAYYSNPLVGGLAAACVGALAGSLIPASRTEEEYLGNFGEQALDRAGEQAHKATDALREKKDEMVDKADRSMQSGSESGSSTGSQSAGSVGSTSSTYTT